MDQDNVVSKMLQAELKVLSEDYDFEMRDVLPDWIRSKEVISGMDKKIIDALKLTKNPSTFIKEVMQAVCIVLYPNPVEKRKNPDSNKLEVDWWAASLKLLGNARLIDDMLGLDPERVDERILQSLGKFMSDQDKNNSLFE